EHAHAHVETIGDRKTNQQNTDQQPPDKTQYFIIDHLMTPVLACRLSSRNRLLVVVATGFQAAWAKARELEHQEQFSHQEQGVQTANEQHGEDQVACGQGGVRYRCWQHLTDRPRLTAIFRYKPAGLDSNPWQWDTVQRGAQQPFFLTDTVTND